METETDLAVLVSQHHAAVLQRARRLVGPEAAEDVAADVVVAAAAAFREGRSQVVSVAWLMTVTRNRAADHLRRVYRERAKAQRLIARPRDPAAGRLDRYPCLGSTLLGALSECAPRHRQVLYLRYVEGRSVKEAAEMMGLTPSAADSLARRALAKLRGRYDLAAA